MIPLQNDSVAVAFAPASITAGATAGNYVDTLGARSLDVLLAVSSATTSAIPIAITLSEGDTTTAFATWTGSTFNTSSTGYVTSVGAVSTATDNLFAKLNVSLLGRKRYIRCAVSGPAANSAVVGGVFVKTREEESQTGTALGADFVANL
jgi:hypothetical protein